MLEITVTTGARGVGLSQPVRFGVGGGTIGRAASNTLMLDDPDRTVSRVHAQVVCRDGRYLLIDRGSNPTQVNGQSLGAGNETVLAAGDRLVIGAFELQVTQCVPEATAQSLAPSTPSPSPRAAAPVSDDDPFAGLLDGLVTPPSALAQGAPSSAAAAAVQQFPDPMASPPSAHPAGTDPFADLLGSMPSLDAGAGGPMDTPAALTAPLPARGSESIDSLFNLGPAVADDPLARSLLADPLVQPNTASDSDPLLALQRAAPIALQPRSDHVPIEHFGFSLPKAHVPALPEEPDPPRGLDDLLAPLGPGQDSTALPPAGASGPGAATPHGAGLQHAAPSAPLDRVTASFGLGGGPREPGLPATASPVASAAPAASHAAAAGAGPAVNTELLAAFVRGLGGMYQPPAALTPDLMERVGRLLRTSTEGALQLLLTRQEFKREVRAQVTMIAAQANNPLKFSPTVEVALAHLLGPGVRGFMPAEAAMRDAYQDLRAHEFGVMVGMRAALAHVIEQFAPDALEQNIAARSKLDAIFSANRKARLWDQFVALYGSIAKEAEDDFHNLFGKAFLQAYEEQMERLKRHDANSHGA